MTTMRTSPGFSLVELLVAMTLGLILLGGIVSVVGNTSRSHGELERVSRQIENGRYALKTITDDIRHAGFYAEYYSYTVPASVPNPCTVFTTTNVTDLKSALGLPIQGYAGGSSTPVSCLSNYKANTDVLVIRRLSTVVSTSLSAGDVYAQTANNKIALGLGSQTGNFTLKKKDGTTAADYRKAVVRLYYIRSCSDCTANDGIPTLARAELSNGAFVSTPIAEGIENMQLRYGMDTPDPTDGTKDGAPDTLTVLPSLASDWANVMTVEVNLLARSNDASPGYKDAKQYTLGDATVPAQNDGFRRRVFSTVAVAINPRSLREE